MILDKEEAKKGTLRVTIDDGEHYITYGFITFSTNSFTFISNIIGEALTPNPNNLEPLTLYSKPMALLEYINFGKPGYATGGLVLEKKGA